jgi:2-C-methyl-D-erythritol 2,4-cyclodiphosphate synthase
MARVRSAGFAVVNVDATIVAQQPTHSPYLAKMEGGIAGILGVGAERVNVKVTSTDGLGFAGRGEGIAALAVASLEPAAGGS